MKMIDVIKDREDRLNNRMQSWANEKMPVKVKRDMNAEKKMLKELKDICRCECEGVDMEDVIAEKKENIDRFIWQSDNPPLKEDGAPLWSKTDADVKYINKTIETIKMMQSAHGCAKYYEQNKIK